jgi:hypothetical protein
VKAEYRLHHVKIYTLVVGHEEFSIIPIGDYRHMEVFPFSWCACQLCYFFLCSFIRSHILGKS